LTLRAESPRLTGVCRFIETAATAGGFDERTSHACQLAICEAVDNIVQHGYHGEPGEIRLTVETQPGVLKVEIADRAPAFDPTRYPVDPGASVKDARVGGRGILMMRRVMDEITYERRGAENILHLTKNRAFTGV
jgi:serine/threonine-protein kinase RsbW